MKIVLRCFCLAATLAIVAGAAAADEASDALASAADQADTLTQCTLEYVTPRINTEQAGWDLAEASLKACDDKLGALRQALMKPPANFSAEKATETAQEVRDGYRDQLIKIIADKRKK